MAQKEKTLKEYESDINITSLSEIYREIDMRRRKPKPLDTDSLMCAIDNRAQVLIHDLGLLLMVMDDVGQGAVKTKQGAFLLHTLNKLNSTKDKIFVKQTNTKEDKQTNLIDKH